MDRIFKPLFYDRSHIAGPGEVSIPFLVDEKPNVLPGGSGRERSEGARKVPEGGARSEFERAGHRLALAGGIRLSDGVSQDIANTVRALDRSRPEAFGEGATAVGG